MIDEAAESIEEAAELLLGGMKITGAGPARNPVYGLIAMVGFYPRQLGGNQIECPIPGYRDEGFDPASRPVAMVAMLEKPLADHGFGHAAGMMDDIGHALDQRRRLRIAFERRDPDHPVIAHMNPIGPPMRHVHEGAVWP